MTCICGHHEAVHRRMCGAPEGCSCNQFSEKQKDLSQRGDMARNLSTPQPEAIVIPVEQEDIGGWADSPVLRLTITPALARRIVAMGQTGEK